MAACAECGRNERQMPSRVDVQWDEARRKLADFLVIYYGLFSPKAEVAGSNPVGFAILRHNLALFWKTLEPFRCDRTHSSLLSLTAGDPRVRACAGAPDGRRAAVAA